jgi:outer membrane lipoprotein LolB
LMPRPARLAPAPVSIPVVTPASLRMARLGNWRRWLSVRSRPFLLPLLMAAITSCAALPEPDREQASARLAFAERAAQLETVPQWRFAARLVLELPEESWTGQLNWRSEETGQVIDLSGPMGRGGGRLFLGGAEAVLITREGERYGAADPDALVALITGRDLPVSGLQYWVRGMARPGAGFDLRADAEGRPVRLIQDGWEIVYGAFEQAGPAAMPVSIDLKRGDVGLRLSIQRWQLTLAAELS